MTKKAVVVPFRVRYRKKKREIEFVLEQYKKAHPEEDAAEFTPHLIAEWAMKKKMWNRPPLDPEELLRRDISRFLHDAYITDPQGREVRKNHPIPIDVQTPKGLKRRWTYKELFHAPEEHMKLSFQLRRRAAWRDVQQLSFDFASYQDNNVFGATLQPMDFDFNKDLAESQLPTTYPSEPLDPLADDDDDDEE